MKSFLPTLIALNSLFLSNGAAAQQSLSLIKKASYDEVADFFKNNWQHISKLDRLTLDCNNILSGNYHKWSYFLAKPQIFKAIDAKDQQYLDSIPTIILTEKSDSDTPSIGIYFPPRIGSFTLDEYIIKIQTDLVIQAINDNKNIYILNHFYPEKFQNSGEFTLCEYLGNLTDYDELTLGNTIFIKKGLLVTSDLSAMITFFNNLHSQLKLKANNNDINLAIYFQGAQNKYAGLFHISNGNLIGELQKLNDLNGLSSLLSRALPKPSLGNELYIYSNNSNIDAKRLQKSIAASDLVLKDLKEFSPPSKIYTLEIKRHDGTADKKYEKIDLQEVKKLLEDNNITCGFNEVCVKTNPGVDLTFECKIGEDAVSVKISTDASLEVTLKSGEANAGSISIDKEGKLKFTVSHEEK